MSLVNNQAAEFRKDFIPQVTPLAKSADARQSKGVSKFVAGLLNEANLTGGKIESFLEIFIPRIADEVSHTDDERFLSSHLGGIRLRDRVMSNCKVSQQKQSVWAINRETIVFSDSKKLRRKACP